jgi:ABC-type multidrug transport system fused ATPase/permease subunit
VSATAVGDRELPGAASVPFVPAGVESRYRPPRATIDPDKSKSWLARAFPVVRAHKLTLLTALILSFVGLVLQVQIPNLLNEAVTNSLQRATVPLSHYVRLVLALGVAAGISAFVSRLFLLRTAYAMEFDLRNIIYEHLTRMSFAFYDRVQSGQLISRANSDIRSVQMYLTFAPSILVQCAVALVAFGYMLSINVPLAFVAMSTTPLVYFSSVRMRKSIFPVSWLIQSRLADVATIVDENINGVRVVKSFVAEPRELRILARAAERLRWAYVQDADIRARFTPTVQNLPQVGLALVLLVGGYLVIHGELQVGAILAFSAYIVMLQPPFQLLGMLIMLGQRAKASAGRICEILDEAPAVIDRPGAIDLVQCDGDAARCLRGVCRARRAGEHQQRAAGGTCELVRRASVDEPTDWAVVARADDQQIERGAVQRQLLDRIAVDGVRLDTERRDLISRIVDKVVDRLVDRCPALEERVRRKRNGLECRELRATLGRDPSRDRDGVLALR